MKPIRFPTVAAAFVLACGDPTEPDRTGSMSFDYRGSLPDSPHGSFSVVGPREPFPDHFVNGAGGFTGGDASFEYTEITGERTDGPRVFQVTLRGLSSVGLMPMCDPAAATPTRCVYGGYWNNGTTSTYRFGAFVGGPPYPAMRVTITAITDRRVSGTFEGFATGTCAACASPAATDTVYFTNGKFDVPYR